ncbi:MAG: hypothetical protein R6X25_14730 [Candidatus Krumholzibacteriia bacterium]
MTAIEWLVVILGAVAVVAINLHFFGGGGRGGDDRSDGGDGGSRGHPLGSTERHPRTRS